MSHEGEGKYSTELWSDEAVQTIQELANSTQPWFLQVQCTVYDDGDVAPVEELNTSFKAPPTIFIPVILILVWSLL